MFLCLPRVPSFRFPVPLASLPSSSSFLKACREVFQSQYNPGTSRRNHKRGFLITRPSHFTRGIASGIFSLLLERLHHRCRAGLLCHGLLLQQAPNRSQSVLSAASRSMRLARCRDSRNQKKNDQGQLVSRLQKPKIMKSGRNVTCQFELSLNKKLSVYHCWHQQG
jgi:hypothetical protein